MGLSKEHISKLREWLNKGIVKAIGAASVTLLTALAVYLPTDPAIRLLLLGSAALLTLWLWSWLRVSEIQLEVDSLKAEFSKSTGAPSEVRDDQPELTELEYSLLCMMPDDQYRPISEFAKKLGRDKIEIRDALGTLFDRCLASQGMNQDYMPNGYWCSTKDGRDYVRKRKRG